MLGEISLIISVNVPLLGMFQVAKLKKQLPEKIKHTPDAMLIDKNCLIEIAAASPDGQIKNRLSKTCKKLNDIVRKTNPLFVGMSTFVAHPRDMNDIAIYFSWNANDKVLSSIRPKIVNAQVSFPFGCSGSDMWSGGGYTCSWPHRFDISTPGTLRIKHVQPEEKITLDTRKLPSQSEIALLFAALCKDKKAVEIIAPKIRESYRATPLYVKRMLQDDLLRKLMDHGDIDAFGVMVTADPYNALNIYDPNDKTGECDKPYLNCLIDIMRYDPEKIQSYVERYRECGGKTLEELEPTKCIIS
jgi:hypothetical protein